MSKLPYVLALLFSACATARPAGPDPASKTPAQPAAATAPGDPLKALEAQLARVHSEKVTVPAQLLRALVRDEETFRGQCRDLSTQLEALKNIDLQQAEANPQ